MIAIFCAFCKYSEIQQYSHYRPKRSCEGYVFTGVCLSTGGFASVHAGIPRGTPPRSIWPPGKHTPLPGSTPPGKHTPPQEAHPPESIPPRKHTPRKHTPRKHIPHPPERLLLRMVGILLECILVRSCLWNRAGVMSEDIDHSSFPKLTKTRSWHFCQPLHSFYVLC